MKKFFAIILLALVSAAGCTTTQKSTATGTAVGAGLGAIIGHQSGHRDKGALIGGAVGALGGYAVGEQISHKKFCPVCGRVYSDETLKYCPHDGAELKYQEK